MRHAPVDGERGREARFGRVEDGDRAGGERQGGVRAQILLPCDSGETPAPVADRALVVDLAGQRPVDLGYAVELRASDLPWAHAGREAEAAGYPRLAT